ncbi:hypothetical protein C8Q76DRAFT_663309, partial [Earliella scabrosa]
MWLLNSHTLRLHHFTSPEDVKEGYVILSHVWNAQEDSFQDLQDILEWCDRSGQDPRGFVTMKVCQFCELAESYGYKWVWIDTCCIDRTSSAELSETINAMYQYYARALVCYVYLADQHHPSRIIASKKWFTRGWTLQELIAPRALHFFNTRWQFMGSRRDLADGLTTITGIPATVLRREQSPKEFSVAQRMSWAAGRETTRVEDEAYCLMGIFGVNIPILYGEGRTAFRRLQEEIMRCTSDTTVFAWGGSCDLVSLSGFPEDALSPAFATSPAQFKACSKITSALRQLDLATPSRSHRHRMDTHRVMKFTMTPQGIRARIPFVYIGGQGFGDLSWVEEDTHLFLVLRHRGPTQHSLPLYDIGVRQTDADLNLKDKKHPRFIRVPHTSRPRERIIWRELYLSTRAEQKQKMPSLYFPFNHNFPATFQIPEHIVTDFLQRRTIRDVTVSNTQTRLWTGNPPLTITFRTDSPWDFLYVSLRFGRCSKSSDTSQADGLWATVEGSMISMDMLSDTTHHTCPEDHILAWPGLKKRFVMEYAPEGGCPKNRRAKWVFDLFFHHCLPAGTLRLYDIYDDYRLLFEEDNYLDDYDNMSYVKRKHRWVCLIHHALQPPNESQPPSMSKPTAVHESRPWGKRTIRSNRSLHQALRSWLRRALTTQWRIVYSLFTIH